MSSQWIVILFNANTIRFVYLPTIIVYPCFRLVMIAFFHSCDIFSHAAQGCFTDTVVDVARTPNEVQKNISGDLNTCCNYLQHKNFLWSSKHKHVIIRVPTACDENAYRCCVPNCNYQICWSHLPYVAMNCSKYGMAIMITCWYGRNVSVHWQHGK